MERYAEIISPNGILRGMVYLPFKNKKKIPFVIMCHGFTGSRTESMFLFVRLSRFLEKKGIGSIRFDFYGSGESDGTFDKMTFSGECKDLTSVFSFIKKENFHCNGDLFLLGLSMGGAVVSVTAPKLSNSKGIILLNPASNMSEIAEERKISAKKVKKGWDWFGLKLGHEFVKDLKTKNILEESKGYNGSVLLVVSTEDKSVPPEWSLKYRDVYKNIDVIKLKDADHTFMNLKHRESLEKIISSWILKKIKS